MSARSNETSERSPVDAQSLREWSAAILSVAGLPDEDAALIAHRLVETDLRGVFSHGTRQLPSYVHSFQTGELNPTPQIQIARDEAVTAVVAGDGGLGFLAAARATEMAVAKAKAVGVGAAVSRNHGHCGAAGVYTRMAVRQGCLGLCASGHAIKVPSVEEPQWNVIGNPPMSIGFPSGQEPPIVLDMGVAFFDQADFHSLFAAIPSVFFKSLGLIAACHLLSGTLAGMTLTQFEPPVGGFRSAAYGAFILAIDIGRFLPLEEFAAEVDRVARDLRTLPSLPGQAEYGLPGAQEWRRERAWAEEGIPMPEEQRRALERLADTLSAPVPWK